MDGVPNPFPIRRALFVGFGLVFTLWLGSGFDLARRIATLEQGTKATTARWSRAEELLSTVRTRVLLGSVYVRDALFDVSDEASEYYRDQLLQTRAEIDKALDEYVPVLGSAAERQQFAQLRAEVGDFWETVLPVLSWDSNRRVTEARALLRRLVIPKRDVIIRISGRIQELNRAGLQKQQQESASIYGMMRRRMWETSGLALVVSLLIAMAVTRHAGRLEARIREQAQRELQNTRDLQRLSAKLVHAQEEERRTIARELHDEIGQALTAIKVELALAERGGARDRSDEAFREARGITDRALQQVRDLSQLLHPALLDDLGLPAALEWHLRRFSTRTGIRAELLQERMEERLATEIETCIYRITQEALTNVARHASASSCRVYLQRLAHTVLLTIEDDGKGFRVADDRQPGASRGLGLLGIQERVAGFRGTFGWESEPGKGTRLTVELPALPREASPEEAEPATPEGGVPGPSAAVAR